MACAVYVARESASWNGAKIGCVHCIVRVGLLVSLMEAGGLPVMADQSLCPAGHLACRTGSMELPGRKVPATGQYRRLYHQILFKLPPVRGGDPMLAVGYYLKKLKTECSVWGGHCECRASAPAVRQVASNTSRPICFVVMRMKYSLVHLADGTHCRN